LNEAEGGEQVGKRILANLFATKRLALQRTFCPEASAALQGQEQRFSQRGKRPPEAK
jgi:hypothetical protein